MPNSQATQLPKLQAQYSVFAQSIEHRTGVKPIVQLGLKNGAGLIGEKEVINIREKESRAIYLDYIKKPTYTTGNARVTKHTGPYGDTVQDPLTWATFAASFQYSPMQLMDNSINGRTMLLRQIQGAIDNIMTRIEAAGVTYLEASKTAVNANNNKLGTWNATTDLFEIALANKEQYFDYAKDNMQQNQLYSFYDVICGNVLSSEARKQVNQGAGNAANTSYQFTDMDINLVNGLTTTGYTDIGYFMPKGTLGMLTWNPKNNRMRNGIDANNYVGLLTDDRYGIPFSLSFYKERTDTSAIAGGTQDFVEFMELSLDVAWLKPPISVTGETPIHGVALKIS